MYVREHINCEEVFVKPLQDLESINVLSVGMDLPPLTVFSVIQLHLF